jgi:serine/threonine-protein kinase
VTIAPGASLGPYEIHAPLGSGGMGEVYRARDARLNRTVAVKVLPKEFARNPRRRERFEREARAVSGLTHPHICALYDVGAQNGMEFLVMEYCEGETLASRIAKRPLRLEQVLLYAIQIAEALDAAHRLGITHRDLKPSNVMLTSTGVKLLDFGVAKWRDDPAGPRTTVESLTNEGTLVGTLNYMAPEQLQGDDADARSDIFSLGAVIYEMATGRRAFEGKSRASVIAAILEREPQPMNALQPLASRVLDRVVRNCLAKDPDERWQNVRDLASELRWIAEGTMEAVGPRVTTRVQRALPWAIAMTLAVALVTTILVWKPWRAAPAPSSRQLSVELGAEGFLAGSLAPPSAGYGTPSLAISPDGSMLAFVTERNHVDRLYLRRFGQLQAAPLITGSVSDPFFSPDGQWIGFFSSADGKLKKVPVAGGSAVAICDIDTLTPRGASWGDDDSIVFNPFAQPWTPLLRVPAAGGEPEPVSTLSEGEMTHRWPQVLPGANAVLFAAFGTQGGIDASDIVAQRLPRGPAKIVLRGAHYARYLRSGYLVYAQAAALYAVPFDVNRLEVTGQPVAVVQGVTSFKMTGASLFDMSDTGTLVYAAGELIGTEAPMAWMHRDGTMTPMRAAPRDWRSPQISPDGARVVFHLDDGRQLDLYVYEWARDFTTRLTSDPAVDANPIWSPDGRTIVFSSSRGVKQLANLYWISADGSGEPHRLTESDYRQIASSWHPSGKYLAFDQQISRQQWDLMVVPVQASGSVWKAGTPTRVLSKIAQRPAAVFSPDGQWLAYTSNESGRSEVFVRAFPGPGIAWQVSTSGGWFPTWSRRRNELFYLSPDSHLMVVSYSVEGNTFRANPPQTWAEQPINGRPGQRPFDVHPDGDRFVVSGDLASRTNVDKVVLISNFFDDVRRRLSDTTR